MSRRLDKLGRQIDTLDEDLAVLGETLSLFILIWLSSTPPLPENAQAAARAKGAERFEGFMQNLGKRLASGDLGFQLNEAFAPDFEMLRHDFNQSVDFSFDPEGGRLFGRLTGENIPTPPNQQVNLTFRHLAIILDGMIVSAPYLSSQINDRGSITMKDSPRAERARLVMMKASALQELGHEPHRRHPGSPGIPPRAVARAG